MIGIKGSSIRPAYFPELEVLKIAILSEKYPHDYTWYVDTILNLIRLAGDYISEEVWYRIVQVVINTQEVQGYAAKSCFEVRQEMVSKSACVCMKEGRGLGVISCLLSLTVTIYLSEWNILPLS